MRRLLWMFAVPLATLVLSGCVHHTFAPGPGMSALDFEPDQAKCRIFARHATSDYEVSAYGSPKFVAAYTASAALAGAIGSAIEQNQNFNDCMQARGWRIADSQTQPTGPMSASLARPAQFLTPAAPMPATEQYAAQHDMTSAPTIAGTIQRREFGARVDMVSSMVANDLQLSPARGLLIRALAQQGAAATAGLHEGDVILSFGHMEVVTVPQMQTLLAQTSGGQAVPVGIWRNGREQTFSIVF
jgi:S1-C subfamily serine protease